MIRVPTAVRGIVAALALTACGARDEHSFSYFGSDEGFEAASAAALEWRDTCGVDLNVERGGGRVPIVEVTSIVEAPERRGSTDRDGDGVVTRIRVVPYEYTGATMAHELGHVLGLEHYGHGLMSAENPGYEPHVTPDDCAALEGQ